jgi:O-antigen/teichoic acid export membrane protein
MTMLPIATNPASVTGITARIRRVVFGNHLLGWADQAVVSAISFLLLVMIGRETNPHELGVYALGISVLALLIATQESLITRPHSIQLHRMAGAPTENAFGALSLSVLLSAAAAVLLGAAAMLLSAFDSDRGSIDIGWVLAVAIPFVLMREFARRVSFAHLHVERALLLDCSVAALTLVGLALLGWFGWLSAASAFALIGVVCGIGSIGWLYLTRHEFSGSFRQFKPTFWRSWQMGKWFLSGQIAMQAQGYMAPWLALIIAGASATGVYAACTSIVAFTNPLLYGFFNVLLPKFVSILQQQGVAGLRRQACLDAILLAGIMGSFSFVIFLFGDDIMHLVYRNEAYAGYGHVLGVLAIAAFVGAVGAPASLALAAAERARSVAFVTALTAVLSLALITALLSSWGLVGAAYGVLAAEIVGSIGRWIAFVLLVPKGAVAGQNAKIQ